MAQNAIIRCIYAIALDHRMHIFPGAASVSLIHPRIHTRDQGRNYTTGHGWDKVQGAPSAEGPRVPDIFYSYRKQHTSICRVISHKNVCSNSSGQKPTTEMNYLFQTKFNRADSRVTIHRSCTSNREWDNMAHAIYGDPLDILSRGPRVPSYATARDDFT